MSRNPCANVVLISVAATAICIIGCGGDDYPSESTIQRIKEIANDLEQYGVDASYSGFDKVLDVYAVGVTINKDVDEIPVATMREIPIPVTVAFSGRNVAVADIRAVAEVPNVTHLSLVRSQVSSEVLAELSSLRSVRSLILIDCEVEANEQLEWALPPNTWLLGLNGSDAADRLLASCERNSMAKLESLGLRGSSIGPDGMNRVASALELKELFLSETRVDDDIMSHIAGLTKLRRLHLDNTDITDAGIRKLKGLQAIEHLGLRDTKLTNAIVGVLVQFPELYILDVTNTEINPKIIGRLRPSILVEPVAKAGRGSPD